MKNDPHDPVADFEQRTDDLRAAEKDMIEADEAYQAALAKRNAAEAMETIARNAWIEARQALVRAVAFGRTPEGPATSGTTSATDNQSIIDPPTTPSAAVDVSTIRRPDGIRPSFWDIIITIPYDGDISLEELRKKLSLEQSAAANRLSKMKSTGLLESSGWGRYKLSAESRAALRSKLRLVE